MPRPLAPFAPFLPLLLLTLAARAEQPETKPVEPLPHAHAHNDYYHPRPLLDALDSGFTSVEADVFLENDELYVGHSKSELKPERTLSRLYLDPLRERARRGDGEVYPGGPPLTLLVDIKSDATTTWEKLNRVLAEYDELVSRHDGQEYHRRAVVVVVSGNRDWRAILDSRPCYAGVDGRLSDLDSDHSAEQLPLISDRWGSHFSWRGDGPMPEQERAKLDSIVRRAHQKGRRVRFWATPEEPAVWRVLRDSRVDLIGTDRLGQLARFFRK